MKVENRQCIGPLRRAPRGRVTPPLPQHGVCVLEREPSGIRERLGGVPGGRRGGTGPTFLPWTAPPAGGTGRYRGGAVQGEPPPRRGRQLGIASRGGVCGRQAGRSAGGGRRRRRGSAGLGWAHRAAKDPREKVEVCGGAGPRPAVRPAARQRRRGGSPQAAAEAASAPR